MAKIYIAAWQGPWSWRNTFYKWACPYSNLELTNDINDADIVFQADTTDWQITAKLPPAVIVIANVLDFGDWLQEGPYLSPEIVEYVTAMKARRLAGSNVIFTAISSRVQDQLRENFSNRAKVFYYPSQVTKKISSAMLAQTAYKKKKQFVSFSRLSDPGKGIAQAVAGFKDSGLVSQGWRYLLMGPETPPNAKDLPAGVIHAGYMPEPEMMYQLIRQSAYVLMPSYGEGLGLPIIEGLLVGTPFVTRNISPMKDVFKRSWCDRLAFDFDEDISAALTYATTIFETKGYDNITTRGFTCAHPWTREIAFNALATFIERVAQETCKI